MTECKCDCDTGECQGPIGCKVIDSYNAAQARIRELESIIMKPLAIDLFCGLFQAKLVRRGYAIIQQFMAGRAQHPKHVALRVFH